jgi:phosphoribosyl 1,2-cyclic phosphodiesterase
VATENTRLLVDAGLSRKETFERLTAAGTTPESLTAILITHEHSDHIAGLQVIAKKLDIPIYVSRLTAPSIFETATQWAPDYIPKVEPVGFSFRAQGIKITIATDLGYMPDSVRFHLRRSDVLLLESNHDLDMLKVGSYPWALKQRIMGRNGHLSNDTACSFIRDDLDSYTSTLILGHLSAHNNHPALVQQAAVEALGNRVESTKLVVAEPKQPTASFVY